MTNRRLFSQLFIPSITIIILVIIIFIWFIIHSVEEFYYLEKTNELKARATLVSRTISNEFLNDRRYLTKICQELGNDTRTRITIISDSGDVLGDSHENPQNMDNHNDRPEVINAREKGIGTVIRYSHTLDQKMMYLAIRVDTFKQPLIIRTSLSIASLQSNITGIRRTILLVGILISILAGGISFILSKQIANPLEVMRQRAEQFAKGDFSLKLPTTNTSELNSLANSLNRMTVQLNNRIQTILQERNEREAVLSSMVEGVLAVDTDEKIISLNKAVAQLFHIERKPAIGKQISSIIRNSNLLNFVEKVLTSKQYQEAELIIHDTTDRFLNITGTVLHNELGSSTGAVFVLNDITRIKKLENIRQEFVANVSHELKTPITAIKGFIETLRNVTDSADRQRFLDILENQSNRLNAIIDNLLKLSRIEGQENSAEILFEEETIKSVFVNAVADCYKIIEEKNIIVQVKCDVHLSAIINAPLLQQALANLLDNAIKYSDIGDQVIISAKRKGNQVLMTVRDFGIGIPEEHFERLFERFYCVDKARSRKLGGTGLGLAIVKHIAFIHNGNVSLRSEVGKGSTFSIIIPEAT